MRFLVRAVLILAATLLAGCMEVTDPAMVKLAREPLTDEPWLVGESPWTFDNQPGRVIRTNHFQIYTTIDNPLYHHMLGRVLEATFVRHEQLATLPAVPPGGMDCYVLATRGQWERYTRIATGPNAATYLQINSGGYCEGGRLVAYDIGLEQTLSVLAHEAWHQYSWFAFKDRLPAWLEEGLATQNEAVLFVDAQPTFEPRDNHRRLASLQQALRTNKMWKLEDLVSTHAGQVIGQPSPRVDAYYAQLWSFTQFLQASPRYAPALHQLLADGVSGKLTRTLDGTSVTKEQIARYTEHWNTVAGPVYLQKYIHGNQSRLEDEYMDWVKDFVRNAP